MKRRGAEKRFQILFIALAFVLLGEPLCLDLDIDQKWFASIFSLTILAVMLVFASERAHRIFFLAIGLPSVIAGHGWAWLQPSLQAPAFVVSRVGGIILLLAASYFVVRSLVARERITIDHLFGAICGYLLLGLAWAVAYSLAGFLHPECFKADKPDELNNPYDLTTYVYFSFTTLTTLGYGDIIPATRFVRTLTWIEAMVGQFYLAVIVAWLISSISDRSAEELDRELNG